MDSYRDFLIIFKEALSTKDCQTLTNIFKEARNQLQIVSTGHLEFFMDNILSEKDGLLYFLASILNNYRSKKDTDDMCRKSFQLLSSLIENFHHVTCFKKYITQIKEICYAVLRMKCNFYIQKDASYTFIKLIERFSHLNLMLDEILNRFLTHVFRVNTIKERKLIYCVIGKIIKHNGNICLPEVHVNLLFRHFCTDASNELQFVSDDVAKTEEKTGFSFHMYFDAIADILENIQPPNHIKDKLFQNLYERIKVISNLNKPQMLLKSAIELLDRHMNYFQNLLYPDYQHWHKVLQHLSHKEAISNCGQHALRTFYEVIGKILRDQSKEESEIVLRYFLDTFYGIFANTNLNLITLRLNVFGYSQMIIPCKMHLLECDISQMYSTIANYALPLSFSEQDDSANVENVCCYQEALSNILCHMSDVTDEKINVLVQLSIYTIKRFPDLEIFKNRLAISSLIKIILNLASVDRSLLQRYLDNIIYDGIAWSCSHTLALDAELQRELGYLKQPPICYKNYLPLWTQLLNIKKYTLYCTVQLIAETLMNVCIMLIKRLDIDVKQQYEDTVLSDVALVQGAVNQADFRVFTNLVDLYVDVIDATDASLYSSIIPDFLHDIIRLSYKHPLISGFYRLARIALKILDCTTEKEEKSETKNLVSSYLVNILELLPTFSNELLITCLYLILDEPGISYVATAVSSARLVSAFRIAFTMGLSDLELAYSALDALKTWTDTRQSREDECMNESLREIVPHLESYLRSTESAVEMLQELTTKKKAKFKRIGSTDNECTLRNFQRRILLFFGSLDHDVLSSFLYERSLNTGASWDRKDLLRYSLLLPDVRLTLHFDRILPRVIALARDSSDRRTRIAACEVLHSMVTLVIGSMRNSFPNSDSFVRLYALLCPILLALGCDSDEVVQSLFQPFTLQLMHWLSSQLKSLPSVISLVLDSIFNSLCDNANPSLREFAGTCLAEFTSWSIRQADECDMQSNVHQIVRRINYFAQHPSVRKRVAAAVAFNHLYRILREDDDTVSIYWLEMFHCFVRSMDGCGDSSIRNALDHIKKVMKVKADILNVTAKDRKKPHDFDDTTLTHALYWLLSQCGVLDEHCRATCKELYVDISQYATCGSAQKTTQIFVDIYGIGRLNDIILRGLNPNAEDISNDNIKLLLKALDYYTWLIKEKLLPIEILFPNNVQEHLIFACIRNFSRQFLQTATTTVAKRLREIDERPNTLQCKAVIATLNFVQVLLECVNNIVDRIVLPESLWYESLFALTIECVMHPRAIGFDVKNIKMMDELPHVLKSLLNNMNSQFSYTLKCSFRRCVLNTIQKYVPQMLNLRDIAQSYSWDEQIQHVNGLIMLEQSSLLDQSILEEISDLVNRVSTIEQIFNFITSKYMMGLTRSDLSAQMFDYLRALMVLQLRHEAPTMELLVRLMSNDTLVTGIDSMNITHGEYFQTKFSNVIFNHILANVDSITFVLDKLSQSNPVFLLKWTENALLHLKQNKRTSREHVDHVNVIDVILQRFACLQKTAIDSNVGSHRERLISIYSTAVHLISKPVEIKRNQLYSELHDWIVQQLIEDHDIEYKTLILRNFLICLTDATDRVEDKRNMYYLYLLKNDRPSLSSNAMKVTNCFETLLVLLSVTGSIIVLDCLINFAAGAGKSLFGDKLKEHLRRYYCREIPDATERVLCSLEMTYQSFIRSVNVEEKLDILHEFLLPAFDHCDAPTTERFFERNIRELHAISRRNISDSINSELDLVSKIGCYQLMAIMCTRLEESKIVDANGTIVRNAGLDNVQDGRELVQSLFKDALNVRKLKIQIRCRDIVRLLHCSAYNLTLAITSLKEDEQFYNIVFAENRDRGMFIWKNIIDCEKHYQLSQICGNSKSHCRETTVNIKSSVIDGGREGQASSQHRYSHIHSYDLLTCSLNEEINAYDFNKSVLLPASAAIPCGRSATINVILESDDFNEHECMPNICGILQRFSSLKKPEKMTKLAECLNYFVLGLQKDVPRNIQLFMLKIVDNTANTVFKPYAKFMLPGIAQAVANYLKANDLNYIITNVLNILISWRDKINDESIGRKEVQNLFEVLVQRVLVKSQISNKHIYNNNLELIRTIMKKWCLTESIVCLTERLTIAMEATVDLIVKLLCDNDEMAREIVDKNLTEDIVNPLLTPLRNWNAAEQDIVRYCEFFGWWLKLRQEDKRDEGMESATRKNQIQDVKQKIFNILNSPPKTTQRLVYIEKQLKRIVVLCKICPDLAVDYITIVIDITSTDKNRDYCLEIFALAMPQFCDATIILSNLHRIELQSVFTNREVLCEAKALQIVHKLVNTAISPADLLPYVKLTISCLEDDSTEHRKLVYNVLMSVYKKYFADSDDENVTILRSESARKLVVGLLDPSEELQTRILRFWTEETDLSTKKSKERLIAVLNLRTKMNLHMNIKEEDAYTLFVPLLILQLTKESRDYNEKMFHPLHNCTYEDYEISVFWRRRNLRYVTPMFVDSLASQMSCTLSQSVDDDRRIYKHPASSHYPPYGVPRLRATQDLQFEPTMLDDEVAMDMDVTATLNNPLLDDRFQRPTTSSGRSSQLANSQSRRLPGFSASSSDVGEYIRRQHVRKNMERQEMMKQEHIRQRNSVKLYRKYRSGDFPDIAIPHSSLIEPLAQLMKLDEVIRKDITVFLFRSLVEKTMEKEDSDNFRQSIVENLKQILHDSEKGSAFNAVILETLLTLNVSDYDSCDIVKVSKANNLNAIGILLLERSLHPEASYFDDFLPTPEKRMKKNEDDPDNWAEIDKWSQLASLYKSIDDVDVVFSIFHEQSYDKNIQEATIANADGDWLRANMAFKRAYESTMIVPSMHEYCMEGLFELMNNLCDWSTTNELMVRANGDLMNVWDKPWRDWMIPRLCDAYVYMTDDNCRDSNITDRDLEVIYKLWILADNNPSRLERIKSLVGEDLVLSLLRKKMEANDLLNDLLDKIGEQWVKLNPLCTELGMRKLRKLQVMSDLHATLRVLHYTDEMDFFFDRMVTLLDFWTTKVPTTRDNLIQWTKLAAYRSYSSRLFNKILDSNKSNKYAEKVQEIKTRIRQVDHYLRLGIVDAALKQKHQYIAQKHLSHLEDVSISLQPRRTLFEARIKYLCASLETDAHMKMRDYVTSWKYSHQLLNQISDDDNVDVDTSIAVREHIGALASTIEHLTNENDVFAAALLTGSNEASIILQDIDAEQGDNPANVRELLLHYSLDKLKSCSDSAATATRATASRNVGEHYYALTRHCHSQLTNGRIMSEAERNDIFQVFVFATLRAMYHDYHEATHYFPCLLSDEQLLQNGAARRTFEGECTRPQPWLFLRWRDLLFSHLGTSIAAIIAPIVEKLAKTYPEAIAYTYLLATEKRSVIINDRRTQRIHEILQDKLTEIEQFLSAMQYVVQPELYLKYYLNEAMELLHKGDRSAFESLLSKVYTPISTAANEKIPRPGSVYNVIAKHKSGIVALDPVNCDATRESVQRMKDLLDKSLRDRANKKRLKEYSPFLHAYAGGNIEIPGQYTGNREPMPMRYHAKIARIEPIVEVMHSLRKPIRISMIGENGREYKFLVKFGEDLTVDHGLQQLYTTMNRTLFNDAACRQRRLMIDTYEVIPLSRSFGLIQWIEDTKSLDNLVSFTLSELESNQCDDNRANYTKWIKGAAPLSTRISDQYTAATAKYSRTEVVTKMKQLISNTKQTALRDTFMAISPSLESFVTLRRNFVASYATMCVAHWIAGIGDRHLENILVVVSSGRCLGIDFGRAFDSSLRIPVPELVPFRLTPQILELMRPFTEKHLFGTIMTHVVRALRNDKGPILACMNIFTHEPINRSSINDEDTAINNLKESTFYFKDIIMTVEKKLSGIHPSYITLKQLKRMHKDEYFTRYEAIITGKDESIIQARALVQDDCLTVTEQVNCLLDQATDLNILGRMYVKWHPWL
ncbi:DNA-dependent protein kinase catalytic subunit isoform X2 [Harpegnathos saltator]|uniref:DNA-dependent protein kinase catalytic subunit isoform X2 n=1 Tax=Harpegnathos saltator TaxID=610380 RepID=UPI000948A33A|nr:DNA-dependent protein kinase catalytic subunit isoform X2 [Harpegnathos saltator]